MRALALSFVVLLVWAVSPAGAHMVLPGETLSGIAAANGVSVSSLAAANGLSAGGVLVAGRTLSIPATGTTTATAPAALGAYTVRPGDTLSGLAATARVPVAQMAAMNGLDPNGVLVAGTPIKLPTGSPAPARSSQPAPTVTTVPNAAPEPTATRVSSSDIAAVATRNGVPSGLASAIAWQESGFNNAKVSAANARGVMQVMPGTWDWVQANLAKRKLDPANAIDNVGAGVLYLGDLLRQTGGDAAVAAAAYYQGLDSVRRIGMLPDTKRYVANVLALRAKFGG